MIWFTLSAFPFLTEKKEAYGLQSGKVSNYTSPSSLTGTHWCLQGEITLFPMYLMVSQHKVFLATNFLCSSKSLPSDILQPATPEHCIPEEFRSAHSKHSLQRVIATSHRRYKPLETRKGLFNLLLPRCVIHRST